MKAIRHLLQATLIASTALLAMGCGHNGLMTVAPTLKRAAMPTMMAAGELRELGYDYQRYDRTQAAVAHLEHAETSPSTFFKVPALKIDNRRFCAPVYDQGRLGSCTAFSIAKGLREYMQRSQNQPLVPLSALSFYYDERKVDQDTDKDAGSTMSTGMFVLRDQGAATDETWPYDISKFALAPSSAADATAATWKVTATTQLASFDDIHAVLAAGNAVAFGFLVYESFQKIGPDGVMPMPVRGESIRGGHAVLAVGYDDKKQLLTVRNSWGSSWGDQGYFYMPYKFAQDMQTNIKEAWTAR